MTITLFTISIIIIMIMAATGIEIHLDNLSEKYRIKAVWSGLDSQYKYQACAPNQPLVWGMKPAKDALSLNWFRHPMCDQEEVKSIWEKMILNRAFDKYQERQTEARFTFIT